MPIRSTFVFWSQALSEPERLLEDLSTYTKVNTLELGLALSTSGLGGGSIPAGEGQRTIISSAKDFRGLRFPTVSKSELASIRRFITKAQSRGFKVACNLSPIYVPTRGRMSLACVDVTGSKINPPVSPPQPAVAPVGVYGCPNNPELARFSETLIRQVVASWAPADIVTLNHVEFPMWPGRRGQDFLIEDLFSCFCGSCVKKAINEGIDFPRLKREVTSLYETLSSRGPRGSKLRTHTSPGEVLNTLAEKPALAAWLHFRSTSMSEYIRGIVRAGRETAERHNPELQIGLEFQLPTLSNILGTDFVGLAPSFDFLVPKFPDYLAANTIPVISDTIAARTGGARSADISRTIREMLDMGPGPRKYRRHTDPRNMLYDVPFDLSMIHRQMKYLEPVARTVPLYPYIWLEGGDADLMRKKVNALRENGIDGYFIWQWEEDLSHETLKERRGVY